MAEPIPDDTSFVVIAGSLVQHTKEIKDVFIDAGFMVRARGGSERACFPVLHCFLGFVQVVAGPQD